MYGPRPSAGYDLVLLPGKKTSAWLVNRATMLVRPA